jgi:Na+/phosphate symporter
MDVFLQRLETHHHILCQKAHQLDEQQASILLRVDTLLRRLMISAQPALSEQEKTYHHELHKMQRLIESIYHPHLQKLVHRWDMCKLDEQVAHLALVSSPQRIPSSVATSHSPTLGLSQQHSLHILLEQETHRLEALLARIRSCMQLLPEDET